MGGVNVQRSLSTFNTTTEVRPLSKAPNPQMLPGRRSIGCPLLRVCVHGMCVCMCVCSLLCVCVLGWVKCRAQILSMGHHTWPHVTSLSLFFTEDEVSKLILSSHATTCPLDQSPHISCKLFPQHFCLHLHTSIHLFSQAFSLLHSSRLKIRLLLTEHAAQLFVQALVISKLDYCNALLAGLPSSANY